MREDILIIKLLIGLKKDLKILLYYNLALLLAFSLLFLIYPKKYISEGVYIPNEESTPTQSIIGSLSQFTSLTASTIKKSTLSIELVKSKSFFEYLIKESKQRESFINLLFNQMDDDNITIHQDTILKNKNLSLQDKDYFKALYEKYLNSFNIRFDGLTGMIKFSVVSNDPYASRTLLQIISLNINEVLRKKKLNEIAASQVFLQKKLEVTKNITLKQSISALMEDYLRQETLATVDEYYALEPLESPTLQLQQDEPNLSIFLIIAIVLGTFLSLIHLYVKLVDD